MPLCFRLLYTEVLMAFMSNVVLDCTFAFFSNYNVLIVYSHFSMWKFSNIYQDNVLYCEFKMKHNISLFKSIKMCITPSCWLSGETVDWLALSLSNKIIHFTIHDFSGY